MAGLTWLHLSDWHQKGEDFNRTVVRDAFTLEEDIHQWLTNEQKRNRLLEPFEAYDQFIKPYAKGNLSNYNASYSLDIDTKTIALL